MGNWCGVTPIFGKNRCFGYLGKYLGDFLDTENSTISVKSRYRDTIVCTTEEIAEEIIETSKKDLSVMGYGEILFFGECLGDKKERSFQKGGDDRSLCFAMLRCGKIMKDLAVLKHPRHDHPLKHSPGVV